MVVVGRPLEHNNRCKSCAPTPSPSRRRRRHQCLLYAVKNQTVQARTRRRRQMMTIRRHSRQGGRRKAGYRRREHLPQQVQGGRQELLQDRPPEVMMQAGAPPGCLQSAATPRMHKRPDCSAGAPLQLQACRVNLLGVAGHIDEGLQAAAGAGRHTGPVYLLLTRSGCPSH